MANEAQVQYAQVASSSTPAALSVKNFSNQATIKALAVNSAPVYIGDANVTTANGYELSPGQSVSLNVTNTNVLYVVSAAAQTVCLIGN